ncbi:MAG: hypothetical protein KAW12_24000 [Candidatus Aminicenantes bacterium]|nr:hypothetical protein [Candidatus Aminicenantes bacterium]
MRVESYFQNIREIIETCPVVQLSDVSYKKRGNYEGFIRGELYFVDGSVLHLREFVDVETTSERLMYAYQYIDASNKLIFRCDNTGHHKKLELPTYPHHKHQGSEENVIPSDAPDLPAVLYEIELLVQLP